MTSHLRLGHSTRTFHDGGLGNESSDKSLLLLSYQIIEEKFLGTLLDASVVDWSLIVGHCIPNGAP